MLVTKLKNKIKIVYLLIAGIIFLATVFTVGQYDRWYYYSNEQREMDYQRVTESESFLENFIEMPYVLYNRRGNSAVIGDALSAVDENIMEHFNEFYPYVEYAIFNEKGEKLAAVQAGADFQQSGENLKGYQTAVVIQYDAYGNADIRMIEGSNIEAQMAMLKDIWNLSGDLRSTCQVTAYDENGNEKDVSLQGPKNRTYVMAMSSENQRMYVEEKWNLGENYVPDNMGQWVALLSLMIAAFAWILPLIKVFETGDEKVFHTPFEIAAIILICIIGGGVSFVWEKIIEYGSIIEISDIFIWIAVYLSVYWAAGVLRPVVKLGVNQYFKERTLIGAYWNKILNGFRARLIGTKERIEATLHAIENVDFTQKNDKMILRIVLINFVIVALLCMMWMFGIVAAILYSVGLFFLLRKVYYSIQEKYAVLLCATNEIAEGNLEREIHEDLGVFNPFKKEISKIQSGFKNAVEKEVKSQRMKTELITNVSHDLKTPLTAIITYVNLLKEEKDEEKRKEYIEVLDKKSHRLKVLIEDLFEISKASSKNVTLHIMDVDIVSLFKQVKLETEEKFEGTGLDFRCNYPEESVIVALDSQKTYRIFENLLVNVAKYAMLNTRVYVDIFREGETAVFRMKNISAAELTFDAGEITERFVRGDESRNTEGSGLGLAIAKSFTEVQKGEFKIETDGDLFKVEVRFKTK